MIEQRGEDRVEDRGGMFANEGRFFKGSKGGAKSTRHILTKDPRLARMNNTYAF